MSGTGLREHVPSVLVAGLSSAFGVALLLVVGVLDTAIRADEFASRSSQTLPLMLGIVALVFTTIAVYVSGIVVANTFGTIIAGRTRTIALLRLIGSSATTQRRAVGREGLLVGVLGALAGAVAGTGLVALGVVVLITVGVLPSLAYSYFTPVGLVPVVAVLLTTWGASWIGSRRVLVVSPMQALGSSVERGFEEANAARGRNAVAITLFAIGTALLILGMVVGLASPFGVLIGLVGGILSFSGIVAGAHLIMPPALRLVGRLVGRGAAGRIAAENAMRYPERSSRTTIGLVIGVTLVTMFAVALESYQQLLRRAQENNPELYEGMDVVLLVTVIVFSVLLGFSAVIAAVGMVNNLSLSVLQRTRELGLLRALGFTARQVRSMIVTESAQLTVAAVLVGIVLGIGYGWAGAQSLLGSINGSPGLIPPAVPLPLLAVLLVASLLLTVAAAVAPARRATRVSPVVALAVE